MIIIFNVCQHPPPTPGPTHSATPGLLTSLGFAKRHFGPISFLAWHVGWPCASREQGAADILEQDEIGPDTDVSELDQDDFSEFVSCIDYCSQ